MDRIHERDIQQCSFLWILWEPFWMAQKVLCCYQNNWTKEYTKEVVRSSHPPLDKITFKHKKADVVASPFQHPTSEEVVVSKVIAQNNYTNQCLHVIGKQFDRMEEKVEKKVIL